MKPVQYIFLNRALRMSTGKAAAQAAHAAVMSAIYSERKTPELFVSWIAESFTKVVLGADNAEHLAGLDARLTEQGFKTFLIVDEGRTELAPSTPTALGIQVVDKNEESVRQAFEPYRLYVGTSGSYGSEEMGPFLPAEIMQGYPLDKEEQDATERLASRGPAVSEVRAVERACDVDGGILADAEEVYDDWFASEARIDWERFIDRLCDVQGRQADPPYEFVAYDSPATRKVQRHIRGLT